MRKSAAIILLFVFFLYNIGYYGFYMAFNYQLDQKWNTKVLEDNLIEEELLHTSIPLSIPYQPDQNEYRTINGKLEIDGNYYRIVSQKYARDTLHVIYVNDTLQEGLEQSMNEWLSSLYQKPLSNDQDIQFWKVLAKDFMIDEFWQLADPDRQLAIQPYPIHSLKQYYFKSSIPSPPPQA